jgi:hypothetical protein
MAHVTHDEIVGGFFGNAFRAIKKVAKKVAKNPLVKVNATGAAFVFPVVGVPLLAATATANGLIAATGDKKKAATALAVIGRTRALAKAGDPHAKRAVTLLAQAATAHVAANKPIARAVTHDPSHVRSRLTFPKAKPLLTSPAAAAQIAAARGRVPVAASIAVPRATGGARVAAPVAARPAAPAASSTALATTAAPVQGWLVQTTGANAGRIDFSGRWRRA